MTVTLHLTPEMESSLLAQAQAKGKTIEEFLLSLAEGIVTPVSGRALTPEQRAAAFEQWAAGHRPTPLLSDYAVSRESMHQGRASE